LTPAAARADSLTVAWDANFDPEVVGYYVFIGTASGVYSTTVDVGSATTYTFTPAFPGTTYYVTVAAYVFGPLLGPHAPELITTIGGDPTLTNPGDRLNPQGVPLTLTLSATDPANDPLTFTAGGLPPGLSLDSVTGVIAGTPTTTGTFSVSVKASDPWGGAAVRYFTWIIMEDASAPTVAISSPAAGMVNAFSSAFVTLTGSVADDIGVTSVTWANSRGGSGTAATADGIAAGSASWSAVVPLQPGTNLLTVTARDGTGRSTTTTLPVELSQAPLRLMVLMANRVAPQAPGTAVTFTATAAGGTAPYQYKWWLFDGSTWSAVRDWSTSATLSWTASAANDRYRIGVWVRSAGSSVDASDSDRANGSFAFPIRSDASTDATEISPPTSSDPLALTFLSADNVAPQVAGTTVTFTAQAAGGTAPYQYKWWLFDGARWAVLGDWSTSPAVSWTPSTANGGYRIGVWVRSAGTTVDTSDNDESNGSLAFPIEGSGTINAGAPLALTALSADKMAPQAAGTTVTFTAQATGGTAPYQYRWWLFDGSTWATLGNWSNSSSASWTPATANSAYRIGVWVRSGTNSLDISDNDASNGSIAFSIAGGSVLPLTITNVSMDRSSPQEVGNPVTFTAAVTGGTGPYSYKWRVFNGTSWTVAQDWNTTASFVWTPSAAGTAYQVAVWARSAGATTDAPENEASSVVRSYAVVSTPASPLRLLALTTDTASPATIGTPITAMAIVAGGVPPLEYKWWLFDGQSWSLLRDWSQAPTYTWIPSGARDYRIGVWVRGSTNPLDMSDNDASNGSIAFAIR
jgi:hypothetical protein